MYKHYFNNGGNGLFLKVTKTITDDKQPISGWDSKSIVGLHYIRSVTYGGYLIASLKFTAKKTSTKQHIKAKLSASLNAGVSLSVKGQFEKLTQAAGDAASMSIYYTSSTIPDLAPINLTTLLKIIDNFPEKVCTVNRTNISHNISHVKMPIWCVNCCIPTYEFVEFHI